MGASLCWWPGAHCRHPGGVYHQAKGIKAGVESKGSIGVRPTTQVDADGTKLDMEATICYLGDMISSNGGCDSVIAARCYVAWGKFRKLLQVLKSRHLSPRVRGKVCTACVLSAMLRVSEMWGPNTSDLEQLHCNANTMWHQRQGSNIPSLTNQKLGIKDITAVLHNAWLRLHGHYSVPRPVSNLSQAFCFPAPEGKESLKRHGLNVSRLISVNVACLVFTHKTEMLGKPVFSITWCCQTCWMYHRQHPYQNGYDDFYLIVLQK